MLMKLIDRIHMVQPFRGSRRIVDAQEEAMHRYVKPEIFNTDQDRQHELALPKCTQASKRSG